MNKAIWTGRKLKSRVLDLLKSIDPDQGLEELVKLPSRRVVNPLFSYLMHGDQEIRWRTITAIGMVVANLAKSDMEAARVLVRRLMWSLNEESGGVGWGAPEALGEIMACHEGLAKEYAHIVISYIMEDGNFVENEWLQRGVIWGLGRLAQARPSLLKDRVHYLYPYLQSGDALIRGLAAWAVGLLCGEGALSILEDILSDDREIRIYLNRKLIMCRVSDLARDAIVAIHKKEDPLKPTKPAS